MGEGKGLLIWGRGRGLWYGGGEGVYDMGEGEGLMIWGRGRGF